MKHKYYLLVIFFTAFLNAQDIQLTGNVKDPTGLELPGVNVLVKGTTNGAVTDFDGNYVINNVSPTDIIVFSYVGFSSQEVSVGNKTRIDVVMQEDSESLEQVVVIGYGVQTKKEITGAVSVIGAETIEELNAVQVENALQGQVAGVNVTSQGGSPGARSTINIRGISTNGDARPLILVDGNVIEDLSVINPNDIESINVLKDATAGIYGVRAANGVILITTKGGRKNQELKFNFDSYAGFQQTTRKIPVLNATEYALIVNESFIANGSEAPFTDIQSLGEGTDYQDEVFDIAPITNINFGLTGGTQKTSFAASTAYLTQDGIVGGDKASYERLTANLNFTYDITDNLKFNTSGIYTRSDRTTLVENTLGSVLFNALNMDPTLTPFDENGEYSFPNRLGAEVINPIQQIDNTFNDYKVYKVAATAGLKYTFFDDFSVESRIQANYVELDNRIFTPSEFYGDGKTANVDEGRNSVVEESIFFRDYTWDNLLRYERLIADNHDLKVLLGYSMFRKTRKSYGTIGFDIPGNTFDNAFLENVQDPTLFNFFPDGRGSRDDDRLLSYFARLQYNYKGKYLLSGVIRRDGSSKFGPENKFGYFPSGSLGWVVSDEDFFGDGNAFNFLKLRGSYGIIGNDRIPAFGFVALLNGEGTYTFGDNSEVFIGRAIGRLSNPELKWELQKTLDIGLDARFANNKLDFTFDYFKRTTDDLLVSTQVSGILGAQAPGSFAPVVNAGSVVNEGLEFSLGYRDNWSQDFEFNFNYNITVLDNEVTEVAGENSFLQGGLFGLDQVPSRMEAGNPLGYFHGYKTDGIFQNQAEVDAHPDQLQGASPGDLRFVDVNNDGVIDTNDRTNIGDPIADVTMGLNIGFTYKNLDFAAYAFSSIGNDMVRAYERNQPFVNRRNASLGRWNGQGTSNEFPRVTTGANNNGDFSDFFVEDASFIRIQNIQLGYTFGSNDMDAIGIDKLRFYVSVNNVYTFTEYQGYDPSAFQNSLEASPIGAGIDRGYYPVPRTYLMGVNLKF